MEEPLYKKMEYRDRILNSLYLLQNKNFLCDVEIVSKDGPVPLHRIIIAISDCHVFKEAVIQMGEDLSFEKKSIICSSFSKQAVVTLVRYLYTGEVIVNQENMQEFIDLCKSVQLNDVSETCIKEVNTGLCTAKPKVTKGDKSLENSELSPTSEETEIPTTNTRSRAIRGRKNGKSKKSPRTRVKKSADKLIKQSEQLEINQSASFLNGHVDISVDTPSSNENDILTETSSPVKKNVHEEEETKQAIIKLNKEGVEEENVTKEITDKVNFNMIVMSPKHSPYYESPELDYFGRNRSKKRKLENAANKGKNKEKISLKRGTKQNSTKRGTKQNSTMTKNNSDNENVDHELEEEICIEETKKGKKGAKRKREVVHRWCHKCEIRFPEKELRKHMRTEHPPYACKLCTWTGLLSRELALHMYNKHEMLVMPEKYPLLSCDHKDCNFKTLVSYALDRHKECHNRLVRHLCDVCGSSFATAGGLREHALRHAEENPIYKCQQCDAVFGWKCKLKSHELKEHGTYLLCEICPYKTKYKDKLTMHLHHEHGQPLPEKQKILRCDQCDFYCINNSKLRFHKLRHEGVKNHTCSQCGKSYLNSHQLKIHINSTHGDRRFSCHLCNYVSKRKSEINNHINSRHSDVRPFTCNLCDYSCKLRGNLQKHIRMVHKVEVVTRNSLHKNMLQTGKGYSELLSAMKTDEIRLGEKVETTTIESETEHTQNEKQLDQIPSSGNVEVVRLPYDQSYPQGHINEYYRRNIEAMMKSRDEEEVRPQQTYTHLASSIYHVTNTETVHTTNTVQGLPQAYSN